MSGVTVLVREAQQSDRPFLTRMLYEAVFWRVDGNRPSFEQALAMPEVDKALADWGERDGDTAVVATVEGVKAGAAWYRYWSDEDFINGYVEAAVPVVVIAVEAAYRRRGVGGRMMEGLIARAARQGIGALSLSVSKDNHGLRLYRQKGFLEWADKGDALLMVRQIGV